MKIAVFAAAALLSGCVGTRLQSGLESLAGQNISAAVDRLGYPDGEREMMGDKVYIWSTNHQVVLPMMTSTTTTGAVGGMPYSGTTTGMAFIPGQFVCTIQIATTPDGTIKRWQYNGNPGGCAHYANALHR